MTTSAIALSFEEQRSLNRAYEHLEHPSFAIRLANAVGTPIEMGLKLFPKNWYEKLQRTAERCIANALDIAISSLRHKRELASRDSCYKMLGLVTGAVGGFFGAPALLVELPLTTTIMLRSIADIARSEGEVLESIETRMACLEVFSLGGRSRDDDAAETGYYGLRLALEWPIANASAFLAEGGLPSRATPAIVELIVAIARRFGVTVSEKAAAEIVPVIGAAGGALVNTLFMQHFQNMARSHFTIRRLERKFGPERIQAAYERVSASRKPLPLGYQAPVPSGFEGVYSKAA